jgi:hypothetical protein
MGKALTRRDFIKGSTFAVMGAALSLPAQQVKKSKVVLIRHKDALDENSRINGEVVQKMLDEAVMTLFGQDDPVDAFKKIIQPNEVVGIKTNVWSYLPTPPEVENAIKLIIFDVVLYDVELVIVFYFVF